MSDFLGGWNAGQKISSDYRDASMRDELRTQSEIGGETVTPTSSGEDAMQAGQSAYDTAIANATTDEQRAQVAQDYKPTMDALEKNRATPAGTVYSLGTGNSFKQQSQPFSDAEVEGARARAKAEIYSRAGQEDNVTRVLQNAQRTRDLADQDALRGAFQDPNGQAGQPQQNNSSGIPEDVHGHYLDRIAPRVTSEYLRQGNVAGAKGFQDFIDSQEGKDYTKSWAGAVRKVETGNFDGAIPDLEKLYSSMPDGQRAKAKSLGDGNYSLDITNEATGQTVGTKTLAAGDLARQAAMALRPEKMAEFLATQEERRTREGATLDRQIELEKLRQKGQDIRDDRRDDRLATRLDAKPEGGELSLAQQRTNDSIDAARQSLTGMSQPDVLKRSQSTTATGRNNDQFDPQIARLYKLANTRKFGDDPAHDAFSQSRSPAANTQTGAQPQGGANRNDIATRFRGDAAMNNYALGKQTPNGVEVVSKGRVIGYYR